MQQILDEIGRASECAQFRDSLIHRANQIVGNLESAQDVVQTGFMRAHARAETYNGSIGGVRPWLRSIVINTALTERKKQKRVNECCLSELVELRYYQLASHDEQSAVFQKDLKTKLQSVLSLLPDRYRVPIELFHWGEFSYEEIAQQLTIPLGTVKTRIYKGRLQMAENAQLREYLNIQSQQTL